MGECSKGYCDQKFYVGEYVKGNPPIANAIIKLEGTDHSCITGEDGFCTIKDLCKGTRYVGCVNHPDYKITTKNCCSRFTFTGCTSAEYIPNYLTPKEIKEAEGKIIAHNINKLPCPNCGEAKEGQEIEVIMGMKNIGDAEGEFRFYIHDQDGNELSKEPDFTYKNVKPGDTWGVHKTLTTNLNFKMLNKPINGKVELRRQK